MIKTTMLLLTAGFLAQVNTPTPDAWVMLFRELGSFGIVVFYVWWNTTHTEPKREERFLAAIKEQRTDYIAAQQTQRTDYITAQSAVRTDFLSALQDNNTAIRELSACTRDIASATKVHVEQARAVWKAQGVLRESPKNE